MIFKTLDVLISTYGDRVLNLPNVIQDYRENVNYYICHQAGNSSCVLPSELSFRKDVKYYKSDTIGVTRSRNILISKSQGDIVYFCDDDIELADDFYEVIVNSHNIYSDAVLTFIVADELNFPRKKQPVSKKYFRRGWFNLLSVGTIEISVKRTFLFGMCFPEDQGAGSNYPSGDEAVFLSKFKRKGLEIGFVSKVICSHPADSSGASTSIQSILSRGLTIKRVYGLWGYILLLPFFLSRKKLFINDEISLLSAFFIFLAGFHKRDRP